MSDHEKIAKNNVNVRFDTVFSSVSILPIKNNGLSINILNSHGMPESVVGSTRNFDRSLDAS